MTGRKYNLLPVIAAVVLCAALVCPFVSAAGLPTASRGVTNRRMPARPGLVLRN